MKKIIVIMVAAFIGVMGTSPAFAQPPGPAECAESDTAPPGCPEDGINYPLVLPDGGTVPDTVAPTVPPVLPKTGSSGASGFLQVGALLLTGGLIVVIASRRRSPAVAPGT